MIETGPAQIPDHTLRHPELVSGSICPLSPPAIDALWMLKRVQHDGSLERSTTDRRQPEIYRQVYPLRIFRFNQVDLPWAMPVFQLLFAGYRTGHIVEHLKSDQPVDSVFRRMSGCQIVAMLAKTLEQVRGNSDIKRAVGSAREYIDAGLFRFSHGRYMIAKWALKQVQDDGWRASGRY